MSNPVGEPARNELIPENSKYRLPSQPTKMFVTPEMASDWLSYRLWDKNRGISPKKANDWREIVEGGDWKTTHQGFAFSPSGYILDGQNRMKGLANSQVDGVWVWVFPDMGEDTFDAIDTNTYARAAAQFLKGSRARHVVAGAMRYISAAIDPDFAPVWRKRLSLHDQLELVRAWPEAENWAVDVRVIGLYTHISTSPLLAVAAMGERGGMSKEGMKEFLEGLKVGAIADPKDPRLQLRNRFVRDHKALQADRSRAHGYALIVKAYNAYATGRTPGRLLYTEGDHIPLPHGLTWGGVRITPADEAA